MIIYQDLQNGLTQKKNIPEKTFIYPEKYRTATKEELKKKE